MTSRLVLIDGINFFYRGAWKNAEILSAKGEDVSYVLSYFRNLSTLIRKLNEDGKCKYVICWDAGYDERLRISTEAVKNGLIPKSYKQERRESRETEDPEEKEKGISFMRQLKLAKDMTSNTIVSQAFKSGEEADDIIGSLSEKYRDKYDEVLLVTTDRDYYQLLRKNVRIYNSGKNEYRDLSYLKSEYNLDNADQWIDVGALAGESGKSSDTIYGVPGIGYATAAKLIAQYGSLDRLIEEAKASLAGDVIRCGNNAKTLYSMVKSHDYKLKHHMKEMYVLSHLDIVELAKKLKAIRTFLDIDIPKTNPSWNELSNLFLYYGMRIGSDDKEILSHE